jgi:hypothetical protein
MAMQLTLHWNQRLVRPDQLPTYRTALDVFLIELRDQSQIQYQDIISAMYTLATAYSQRKEYPTHVNAE